MSTPLSTECQTCRYISSFALFGLSLYLLRVRATLPIYKQKWSFGMMQPVITTQKFTEKEFANRKMLLTGLAGIVGGAGIVRLMSGEVVPTKENMTEV